MKAPLSSVSRRAALAGFAAGLSGCASSANAAQRPAAPPAPAAPTAIPTALAGSHAAVPLPFAPSSLRGLSEKMIVSHHENNYGGAVRNLNRVEQELAKVTSDTPPFVVAALHERELGFRNSKSLHEAYFGNLGGGGARGGAIEQALTQAYGSATRWEEQFRAAGLGLGGGSGWVVLAFELDTGAFRIVGAGNHTQALAHGVPLLVLDMYEHSYQMDYGAAAGRYIDAFFANVSWEEVNRRLERARRLSTAFKG